MGPGTSSKPTALAPPGMRSAGLTQSVEADARLGEMMRSLVQQRPRDGLPHVAATALEVVPDADLAVLLGGDGGADPVLAAAGNGTESWVGEPLSLSAAVVDPVLRAGMNLVIPGLRLSVGGTSYVVSALVVPVPIDHGQTGILLVGRLRDRQSFTSLEMAPLTQLARRVELSFEILGACLQHCEERLHAERERVAARAQEHIVAPLFAASLELAGLAGVADPALEGRLLDAVTAIDEVVTWLRANTRDLGR
ncbi:MAG TPA: hypothetical protein VFM09_14685 [Marmoricola sp.]|nr:hypothetical protein [Marmoricola sp.]